MGNCTDFYEPFGNRGWAASDGGARPRQPCESDRRGRREWTNAERNDQLIRYYMVIRLVAILQGAASIAPVKKE